MEKSASTRRRLDEQNVLQIMTEWNHKSIEDFAEEFQVAPNTVRAMVSQIRKNHPELCPKKSRKTRADVIEVAFKMLKSEDRIED